MRNWLSLPWFLRRAVLLLSLPGEPATAWAAQSPRFTLCCRADNDLYQTLHRQLGTAVARFDEPARAVAAAPEGGAVLILADGYPERPTAVAADVFAAADRKRLRLYVEFPAALPGCTVGLPRDAVWERVVVASEVFGAELRRGRLLTLHRCRFVPIKAHAPFLVLGRVAGFDTAVFGLPKDAAPLLFDLPAAEGRGAVMVAASKLSQFVTTRYAPVEDWRRVWEVILGRLEPGGKPVRLEWQPTVRPTYERNADLPADAEATALRRGYEWFRKSRLLVHPSRVKEIADQVAHTEVGPAPPADAPVGDGSLGILEGYDAGIAADGRQRQRLILRSDCISESAMGLAFGGKVFSADAAARETAGNLQDFLYRRSGAIGQECADPAHAAYGLIRWGVSTPAWRKAFYSDDNARVLLATAATAALTDTQRWDEPLMRGLLANLRTTGPLGFRVNRIDQGPLTKDGWQHYLRTPLVSYQPHYQASLWACFLWAHQCTGDALFLDRARTAIRLMMRAYPDRWRWTNGIQQERARMLLPLAWLVRVEDTAEHRRWLALVADDLLAGQHASGAIREELGSRQQGDHPPPLSNAAFGGGEASLIQDDSDSACDLLYTTNYAFLGLHEAAAATGERRYREAEDRLARFLCRIQVRSDKHPELDGAWFRAFDFRRGEYWSSNGDHGWGTWSAETGWTQSWIVAVLALRQLRTSLWELTADSKAARHFPALRRAMLPDEVLRALPPAQTKAAHAAVGKAIELATKPDPRYPGAVDGLTDGVLSGPTIDCPDWLGYEGRDFQATIDLGKAIDVHSVAVHALQDVAKGVLLPARVTVELSADGRTFTEAATVNPSVPKREAGALTRTIRAEGLTARARFVRVHVVSRGTLPAWHPARGGKAWLFVDEVLVNPAPCAPPKP